jgi:hypothetical protein
MPAHHIIQLLKNINGNDYIIGDVHGCNDGLRTVIDALNVNDRLFLVGDLFDRGPDSIDVYNLILDARLNGKEIYITRGNHEDLFLKAIPCIMHFKENPEAVFNKAAKQSIYDCLRNGGSWIFSKIEDRHLYHEDTLRHTPLSDFNCDKTFFTKPFHPNLQAIHAFLDALPYIILVGDIDDKRNSFLVCHADMPLSDAALKERLISVNAPLADGSFMTTNHLLPLEIQHVTWERPDNHELKDRLYKSDRSADSLTTYCGHSILFKFPPFVTRAVRHETNHINLDAGAYLHPSIQLFLRMNHTTGQVDVLSGGISLSPSIEDCSVEIDLQHTANTIMKYIARSREAFAQKQLNSSRADLILSLKKELPNYTRWGTSSDPNLDMLALILFTTQAELNTPLLTKGRLSGDVAKKLELIEMIRELNRLMENDTLPSTWKPGPLATQTERYCCFFSRSSKLNHFHDQVVKLGGTPTNAAENPIEQEMR